MSNNEKAEMIIEEVKEKLKTVSKWDKIPVSNFIQERFKEEIEDIVKSNFTDSERAEMSHKIEIDIIQLVEEYLEIQKSMNNTISKPNNKGVVPYLQNSLNDKFFSGTDLSKVDIISQNISNKEVLLPTKILNDYYDKLKFTSEERRIHERVCSFNVGEAFTDLDIAKLLNSNVVDSGNRKRLIDDINITLHKFRHTEVTINLEKLDMHYHNVKIENINDTLLSFKKVRGKARNGKEVNYYILKEKPVLFKYSESIGQIRYMPSILLNNKKTSITKLNETIRDDLIHEIGQIESLKNKNTIDISRLYTEIKDRKLRAKYLNSIEIWLELWKHEKPKQFKDRKQKTYIKDYYIDTKKRIITIDTEKKKRKNKTKKQP